MLSIIRKFKEPKSKLGWFGALYLTSFVIVGGAMLIAWAIPKLLLLF